MALKIKFSDLYIAQIRISARPLCYKLESVLKKKKSKLAAIFVALLKPRRSKQLLVGRIRTSALDFKKFTQA